MTKHRNNGFRLCDFRRAVCVAEHFPAAGAGPVGDVSGFLTRCRLCRCRRQTVACGVNRAGFRMAGVMLAGTGFFPRLRTGRFFRYAPLTPIVVKGRDYHRIGIHDFRRAVLVAEHFPAVGAGPVGDVPGFLTGRRLCRCRRQTVDMGQFGNRPRLRVAGVVGAGPGFHAVRVLRGGRRYAPLAPIVTQSVNGAGLRMAGVMLAGTDFFSSICAGRLFRYGPLAPVMTKRRNDSFRLRDF